MKGIIWGIILFATSNIAVADFPINNYQVTVTKLEVWPSNNGAGRYNAWVSEPIRGTGCANENGFTIEEGPGSEAAYSTLLAAALAGKKIELYLTRCEYFVVADRVRIIP